MYPVRLNLISDFSFVSIDYVHKYKIKYAFPAYLVPIKNVLGIIKKVKGNALVKNKKFG